MSRTPFRHAAPAKTLYYYDVYTLHETEYLGYVQARTALDAARKAAGMNPQLADWSKPNCGFTIKPRLTTD